MKLTDPFWFVVGAFGFILVGISFGIAKRIWKLILVYVRAAIGVRLLVCGSKLMPDDESMPFLISAFTCYCSMQVKIQEEEIEREKQRRRFRTWRSASVE